MPNWRAVRRVQAPSTLKSRISRQVPLSGEELPPQYPCHSCKNAKYASQLRLDRGPLPKRPDPSGGFSGRLHRI
jgi:hypothetical protein